MVYNVREDSSDYKIIQILKKNARLPISSISHEIFEFSYFKNIAVLIVQQNEHFLRLAHHFSYSSSKMF